VIRIRAIIAIIAAARSQSRKIIRSGQAIVAGIYNLRVKQNEYVNEYYKDVIKKRIAAYEQLEELIGLLKTSFVGTDGRAYHRLFASEKEEDWVRIFQTVSSVNGLWVSDRIFSKARELCLLIYQLRRPSDVIEFGKKHYQAIATIRADLERMLATDMLRLHDVKGFLKSKDQPDPGFSLVNLGEASSQDKAASSGEDAKGQKQSI
jgi:hypothetical protein